MTRQAKNLKNYTGAMSGIFDPGQLAEDIMPGVEYGNLFAYLFRRFGYPQFGWDNHKELVQYFLSTKIKGVYLDVSPRPSGLSHSFGYILSSEINKQCVAEEFAPVKERRELFLKWRQENGKEITASIGWETSEEDFRVAIANWNNSHPEYAGIDGGEEEQKLFWEHNRKIEQEQYAEFNLINPTPQYSERHNFTNGSLRFKINEALKETLTDLLRPVYVRDVPITPYGVIADKEVRRAVSCSAEAGKGLKQMIQEAKQ